MNMNPNLAAWLDALESNHYKQCKYRLREGDCFDCLGVACDLHAKATGNQWVKVNGEWQYLGEGVDIPIEVKQWLGLDLPEWESEILKIEFGGNLGALNDNGHQLWEIAEVVREAFLADPTP